MRGPETVMRKAAVAVEVDETLHAECREQGFLARSGQHGMQKI
jgi:hypothetical protein